MYRPYSMETSDDRKNTLVKLTNEKHQERRRVFIQGQNGVENSVISAVEYIRCNFPLDKAAFLQYIRENFMISKSTDSLISNILDFVEAQGYADSFDAYADLSALLDDSIGLDAAEIARISL